MTYTHTHMVCYMCGKDSSAFQANSLTSWHIKAKNSTMPQTVDAWRQSATTAAAAARAAAVAAAATASNGRMPV